LLRQREQTEQQTRVFFDRRLAIISKRIREFLLITGEFYEEMSLEIWSVMMLLQEICVKRKYEAVRWRKAVPLTWISLCAKCCVFSRRGPCVGLITRPEESYRVWCVWVWS